MTERVHVWRAAEVAGPERASLAFLTFPRIAAPTAQSHGELGGSGMGQTVGVWAREKAVDFNSCSSVGCIPEPNMQGLRCNSQHWPAGAVDFGLKNDLNQFPGYCRAGKGRSGRLAKRFLISSLSFGVLALFLCLMPCFWHV